MVANPTQKSIIIRTEKGLTISGTRITLYDVIDFLKAQYPAKLIRDKFNLTDTQIQSALSYIEANQNQIEIEYQEVLQTRQEIRQYWENYNRQRLAEIAVKPHKAKDIPLWEKLEAQKAQRIIQKK